MARAAGRVRDLKELEFLEGVNRLERGVVPDVNHTVVVDQLLGGSRDRIGELEDRFPIQDDPAPLSPRILSDPFRDERSRPPAPSSDGGV